MSRWTYDFDCHNCMNRQPVDDGIRKGIYCIPLMEMKHPIHTDGDRHLRCDQYRPMQVEMKEEE